VTFTIGDLLHPSPVAGGVHSASAPSAALSGFKFIQAAETTVAVSARGYVKGIIHCV
jgi:hypothetical protein